MQSDYRILQLTRNATQRQVKKKYYKLALKYHPDKHQDPEEKASAEDMFILISGAYDRICKKFEKEQEDEKDATEIEEMDKKIEKMRAWHQRKKQKEAAKEAQERWRRAHQEREEHEKRLKQRRQRLLQQCRMNEEIEEFKKNFRPPYRHRHQFKKKSNSMTSNKKETKERAFIKNDLFKRFHFR